MVGQITEARTDQLQLAAIGFKHLLAVGDGLRIPVKRNYLRTGIQNGSCVTSGTKCAVDNDLPGLRVQRHHDLLKKNRDVAHWSATDVMLHAVRIRRHPVSPCPARAGLPAKRRLRASCRFSS